MGISELDLVGAVFIILKLTDVVSWHWEWVLAPFWIPLVIAFISYVFFGYGRG